VTADGAPRFCEAVLAEYQEILTRYPERRAALLPTLWLAQREFGWLSLPVQEYVADLMEMPLSWVTSVVSFYTMFWTEPKGRHHLQLCVNLSCALRGSDELRACIERRLRIGPGERTADGVFSFEEVECLASCGTAPVMQVSNTTYHESLDVPALEALLDRLVAE
jgi:NADH-quinone oxidoreductase subunit E